MAKKSGRPRKIDDNMLAKLRTAFLCGLTDEEACLVVDIDPSTLWRYKKRHKTFAKEIPTLKDNVKAHAKMNVAIGILKDKDVKLSQWYLEHRDEDFKNKLETQVSGNMQIDNPFKDVSKDDLINLRKEIEAGRDG